MAVSNIRYMSWLQRYSLQSRQRLDIALLHFFQHFRKVYVGEVVMHASKVYERLRETVGIEDHLALLDVILRKVIHNLKVSHQMMLGAGWCGAGRWSWCRLLPPAFVSRARMQSIPLTAAASQQTDVSHMRHVRLLAHRSNHDDGVSRRLYCHSLCGGHVKRQPLSGLLLGLVTPA
jgi:hypothetical protein